MSEWGVSGARQLRDGGSHVVPMCAVARQLLWWAGLNWSVVFKTSSDVSLLVFFHPSQMERHHRAIPLSQYASKVMSEGALAST